MAGTESQDLRWTRLHGGMSSLTRSIHNLSKMKFRYSGRVWP
jgi:hypothetical protein